MTDQKVWLQVAGTTRSSVDCSPLGRDHAHHALCTDHQQRYVANTGTDKYLQHVLRQSCYS